MIQFKKHIKIFTLSFCAFASIFLTAVGHSAPASNSPTNENSPESVWNEMKACLATNNISGATSCFSVASKDKYQRAFSSMSKADLLSYVKGLGPIKQTSITDNRAKYYFESMVDGQKITFPIEFSKEDGVWKILEF